MTRYCDDAPILCDGCGTSITAGHDYYVWRGKNYCCEECVMSAMYEEYESDLDVRHLYTAEEKIGITADIKYEARLDDELMEG
jgi:hypothetical protein